MSRTLLALGLSCTVLCLGLPGTAGAAPCGNITYIGCCDGTTAKYCKSGSLVTKDCSKDKTYGPACGWATGLSAYSCNKTATKDPNGKYIRECSKLPDGGPPPKTDAGKKDAGAPKTCPGIPPKSCCVGALNKYCNSSGKIITKDCCKDKTYGPACGWVAKLGYYACNKTATNHATYPRACGKLPDGGTPPKYDTGTKPACGKITSQGCCDGETVKYCSSSKLNTKSCTSSPKCGWDSTKKYYTCGTKGQADPNGKYPMKCPGGTTTPDKGTTTKQDKGTTTTPDKGTTTKQDTGSTTTKQDTGSGGTSGGAKDDEGCSCSLTSTPAGAPALLLLLVLGLLRRRRS